MFKFDSGVVLIEMLMSLIVISFIMLLLLALTSLVSSTVNYEQTFNKALQVSTLMIGDISSGVEVELSGSCLQITENVDIVTYCIEGDEMIRRVNGKGYERVVSNAELSFDFNQIIYLKVKASDLELSIPLWSTD